MAVLRAPWKTWWQNDIPCRFSPQDAAHNCTFLMDLLEKGWLQRALEPKSRHPLVSRWMTNDANAFLLLNALAEDARLLHGVAGFDEVVKDLRNGKRCLPAWHVIRAAAMFRRGGATITQFYKTTDEPVPDFSMKSDSVEANIEAKLMLESDAEEAFGKYARPLLERVFREAMAKEAIYPPLTIIAKDPDNLPDPNDVVTAASLLVNSQSQKELRRQSFNLFVDVAPPGGCLYRGCYILCPRSDRENLRVASRIKEASGQLLSAASDKRPGIPWIGLTEKQDPLAVRDLLQRRFARGEYGGVSVAVLSLSGTHLQLPRRSTIDFCDSIVNRQSLIRLSRHIPIKALDFHGSLFDLSSSHTGIPAYRVAAVERKVAPDVQEVWLADIRRIQPQLL